MNTKNVEIRRSSGAAQALASILQAGPLGSRAALETMAEQGFTPKQVRLAREYLQVVIERRGQGAQMRSTWRLPDGVRCGAAGAKEAQPVPDIQQRAAAVDMAPAPPVGVGPRFSRRVAFFVGRGLAIGEATELAHALDVRDLTGARKTSCAECQCWVERGWCRNRRPALELHNCDAARRDAP
jgi:hypothetical protein